MQYKVPQNVQRADRIVGPLTMRQLIICTIGFSIAYFFYSVLSEDYQFITWIIPVVIVTLITIIFAFIKPNNLTFEKYILFAMEFYFILPRKRYWIKGTADISRFTNLNTSTKKKEKKEQQDPEPDKYKKLKDALIKMDKNG